MSNYRVYATAFARQMQTVFLENGFRGNRIKNVVLAPRYLAFLVQLSQTIYLDKAIKIAEQMALRCHVESVIAHRQKGEVVYEIQLPKNAWKTVTRNDINGLGVGLGTARSQVNFDFSPPHSLVAGSTGSGKSETLKTILLALLSNYTPENFKLLIVDPHQDFTDFDNVVHLAGPIARTPEEIKKALQYVNQVFLHRRRENIRDDYRLLLVIDEAQTVFQDEESLEIAQSLVNQSRKFKVNVIVSTGKPDEKSIPRLMPGLDNKFVGKVTNSRLSASISGHAGLQLHKLLGQGDFCHISPAGVRRFQVALTSESDFSRLSRGEVAPVELDDTVVILPAEPRKTGRPKVELQPGALVAYLAANNDISISQASASFALKRTGHDLHKRFTAKMLAEMVRKNLKIVKGEK